MSCIGNCSFTLGGDHYDLTKLPRVLTLKAGDLFTSGGTAYYHSFNVTLCGPPTTGLCRDNNTDGFVSSFRELANKENRGVRAMACRSTLLPDQQETYATQSVSLGDRLIAVTRETQFHGIRVHEEFTGVHSDLHFYFATDTVTTACTNGRALTVTLRCDLLSHVSCEFCPSSEFCRS